MNFAAITRTLSYIALVIDLAFVVCGGCDYWLFKNIQTAEGWCTCVEITSLIFTLLFIFSINQPKEIFRRESFAIVGLSWLLVSFLGALPYIYILSLPFVDALFESASGISTTGISLIKSLENLDKGVLLWRSLSQWIGGLGIAVFFVAVMASMGTAAKKILVNESSFNISDFDSGKVKTNASALCRVYFLLTFAAYLTFWICGMNSFDATCHAFSIASTGGFSTHNEGFCFFQSPLLSLTAMVFMVLGGTNFLFFVYLLRKSYAKIKSNEEVKLYFAFISIAGILLFLSQFRGSSAHISLFDAYFQSISAISSCGLSESFTTSSIAQGLLILFMLCGGCTGSTAGGFKVARIGILLKGMFCNFPAYFRPQRIRNLYFNHRLLKFEEHYVIADFFILACFSILCFTFLFAFFEPQFSLIDNFSTVCTLISNSGMMVSTSCIDVRQFHAITKLLSIFIMIFGRIEFYALIVLFIPEFWRKY